jgi:hypothetical protein
MSKNNRHAPPASIRPLYDEHGVEGYYRAHAGHYENPHFPEIKTLLERNLPRFDTANVLDFAAGGGEVTRVLQACGVADVSGCDPYTYELYERRTQRPCLRLSFKDVIRTGLPAAYSTIISSFALHLCPREELYPLAWNLLQAAPLLLVVTPHKRPALEELPGFVLAWEDSAFTEKGKRVRLKAYRL